MAPKWSDNTTCKFVKLYKQHECLWNTKIELYRNKNAREAAIIDIIEAMELKNFTVADVKNKIKSLRGTYQQEVLKIEKSEKSGVTYVYKPAMKWFCIMTEVMGSGTLKRSTQNNLVSTIIIIISHLILFLAKI